MLDDHLWQNPYGTFLGSDETHEEAPIVLFGAPLDSTTCFRPGTRDASRQIRYYSYNLEEYSIEQMAELLPGTFFDAGDLELPFGDAARALELIERATASFAGAGKLPVVLGGEHLISAGVARGLASVYPDAVILHVDAHYDLRTDYMGVELSHATAMNLCRDAFGMSTEDTPARLAQMGIRSGPRSEAEFARDHIPQLFPEGLADLRAQLTALGETWRGRPLYCTFDIDAVDPAFAPGTGTPEAGGLSSLQALEIMRLLPQHFDVIGVDIVETNPSLDHAGITCALVAKMVRELLISLSLHRTARA